MTLSSLHLWAIAQEGVELYTSVAEAQQEIASQISDFAALSSSMSADIDDLCANLSSPLSTTLCHSKNFPRATIEAHLANVKTQQTLLHMVSTTGQIDSLRRLPQFVAAERLLMRSTCNPELVQAQAGAARDNNATLLLTTAHKLALIVPFERWHAADSTRARPFCEARNWSSASRATWRETLVHLTSYARLA
ncbi:hypothetical protein TrVFT333_002155 [Trichoderma virens FT-333]|nr:hypothetical protein TrVFT333_002155 [Trichoderma virens FT-333]